MKHLHTYTKLMILLAFSSILCAEKNSIHSIIGKFLSNKEHSAVENPRQVDDSILAQFKWFADQATNKEQIVSEKNSAAQTTRLTHAERIKKLRRK